jgi:hypothetical protein
MTTVARGQTTKVDFILSDEDHHHTQEWFEHVYDNLLNAGGMQASEQFPPANPDTPPTPQAARASGSDQAT